MAAHLHDSVLQTLSLIQRSAADPRAVTTLARKQERELRSWLYASPDRPSDDGLSASLARVAAEVEEMHGVPVDVVTVGECPLDDRLAALVLAAREAVSNAAVHAGVEGVSLYAEVEPAQVTVFVRDRGIGFDLDAVGPDRRGVADSIIGRVRRNGGRATIHTALGEGTEVELVMARARP
jgi:signal transduction histidine kinase